MDKLEHELIRYRGAFGYDNLTDPSTKIPFEMGDNVVICRTKNSLISQRSLEVNDYLCPFCLRKLDANLALVRAEVFSDDKQRNTKMPPVFGPTFFHKSSTVWRVVASVMFLCLVMSVISVLTGIWGASETKISELKPTRLSTSYLTQVELTNTFTPAIPKVPINTATSVSNNKNQKDQAELIYIPAGEFTMGSAPEHDPYFWGAESPPHDVYLDSYYIYETEVTNSMFEVCTKEKACPRPNWKNSRTRKEYYGNPDFADYPVVLVSWMQAVSYCKWVGGRLPSEAEWEKAARGTDERLFPWGDSLASGVANYCGDVCANDTMPVGQFLDGASPYGVLDMAGNVWEWVNDYFNSGYYNNSPPENPLGPSSGSRRVIRGGAWHNPAEGIRVVARSSLKPDSPLDTVGFRCVIDNP